MEQFIVDTSHLAMYGRYHITYKSWYTLHFIITWSKLDNTCIRNVVGECGGEVSRYDETIDFKNFEDAKKCADTLNSVLIMSRLTVR
jgi:hypothetical protein